MIQTVCFIRNYLKDEIYQQMMDLEFLIHVSSSLLLHKTLNEPLVSSKQCEGKHQQKPAPRINLPSPSTSNKKCFCFQNRRKSNGHFVMLKTTLCLKEYGPVLQRQMKFQFLPQTAVKKIRLLVSNMISFSGPSLHLFLTLYFTLLEEFIFFLVNKNRCHISFDIF